MARDETQTLASDDPETPAKDKAELAQKWINEIKAAEKAQAKWVERAKKIEKIYADERDATTARARKFNILYSNVETLRPAVYMQTPKAQVVRRYRDRDPVARLASLMLERCVQTSCELYGFDAMMDQAVRDRLVPGRGQAWVSYVPGIEADQLAYENVEASYVPWPDFLHSPTRVWEEVRWVGRRFCKTRTELARWLVEAGLAADEKAAKRQAKQIQLDYTNEDKKKNEGDDDERGKAQVWEIHDKTSRMVIYVAPGSNDYAILGQKPPAIQFRDFFPCPRPLLGVTTARSLIPVPDYAQYQDQAEELNRATERIGVLQKAISVKGLYPSTATEVAKLLETTDNVMVPVENWNEFKESGGVNGSVEWFPLEVLLKALESLYLIRDQAKQTLYEVSGIGDILRGVTDPDETATAQGIKSKWGSLRVRRIQKDVQRFAADIMRLKAEVIAEAFQPRTIMAMAGMDQEMLAKFVPQQPQPQLPPDAPPEMQQMAQMQAQQAQQQAARAFMAEVFKLLKDDTARNFRIDVETDSTLEPDQAEEKEAAIEFMTAVTAFMEKAGPIATSGPEAAKLVGQMLLFGVRRFDKVDELEQTIEQAMEAFAQPRPQQPDPETLKLQQQAEKDKGELAIRAKEVDGKLQLENKRIEEVEKPKLRVDALLKAGELKQRQSETVANDSREREKIGVEKEKVRVTDENNKNVVKLKRREAMSPEEREADEASEAGKPSTGEALMALVEQMKRPIQVKRGADGRVVGFE